MKLRDQAQIRAARAASPALDQAARLAEKFAGRPARWVRPAVDEDLVFRSSFSVLARLLRLQVEIEGRLYPIRFSEARPTNLGSSADGRNLFFLGGDQSLDLLKLGLAAGAEGKDKIDIGQVRSITYLCRKSLDRFEPVEYTHDFGKVEGRGDLLAPWQRKLLKSPQRFPRLVYDQLNRKLELVGGAYIVLKEGIVF